MSIILQKGDGYSADFSLPDYPVLTSDWTASVSIYSSYPGDTLNTKTLTKSGNVFVYQLTAGEIISLPSGSLTLVATATNAVLSVNLAAIEFITVSDIKISTSPTTKIFGIIEKQDGTPAGNATSVLVASEYGTTLRAGWAGEQVTFTLQDANSDSGKIVGAGKVVTTTDANGYFEHYVIQGLVVVVSSPVFGKSVAVATAGLTEIDISTFF